MLTWDPLVMALPLRILWNLHITRRQKFGLAGVFSLAAIVIVFAIVRAVETISTLTPSKLASLEGANPISLTLFSALESTIAVIVSCLPTFRVLILGHSNDRGPSDVETPTLNVSFSSFGRSCSQASTPKCMKWGIPSPQYWLGKSRRKESAVNSYRTAPASYSKSNKASVPQLSQRTVESDRTLVGTPMTEFVMMTPKPVAREWPKLTKPDSELGINKPLPPPPPRTSTPMSEETYEAVLRSLR